MDRTCLLCGQPIGAHRNSTALYCGQSCISKANGRNGCAAAIAAVGRAVRKGLLKPAKECTCVDCGKQARDYDHRDYNKPLDVVPVCRSCNQLRGPAIPLGGIGLFTPKQAKFVTPNWLPHKAGRPLLYVSAPSITATEA